MNLNNRIACVSWKEWREKGHETGNRARTSGSQEGYEGTYLMRCHVRRMSGTGHMLGLLPVKVK
jgi:hypothetical protein